MNSLHNHREGILNILLHRIVKLQTTMVMLLFVMMEKRYSELIILIGIWCLGLVIWDYVMNILINEYWKITNRKIINNRKFSHNIFYDYFSKFDNQSIEKSLSSENAIVRMLAILDRRVGKRRIISILWEWMRKTETEIKNYKKLFFGFKEVKWCI